MSSPVKYIDGWLQFKEKGHRKYEERWFVLKAEVSGGVLALARLFCFKDQNTHVREHLVGSHEIRWPHDHVILLKKDGSKPRKCEFSVKIGDTKFNFRADDDISRERWIYALCDLVGQGVTPGSELPSENNNIRSKFSSTSNQIQFPGPPVQASIYGPSPGLPPIRQEGPKQEPPLLRHNKLRGVRSKTIDFTGRSLRHGTSQFDPHAVSMSRRGSEQLVHPFTPDLAGDYVGVRNDLLPNVPWYYPGQVRIEAEALLSSRPLGTYLLRDCESNRLPGFYTLTYRDHAKVCHHMIRPDETGKGFRFDNSEIQRVFSTPVLAVDFYMKAKKTPAFHPVAYSKDCHGCDGEGEERYLSADSPGECNSNGPASVPPGLASSSPVPPRPMLTGHSSPNSGRRVPPGTATPPMGTSRPPVPVAAHVRYANEALPPIPNIDALHIRRGSTDRPGVKSRPPLLKESSIIEYENETNTDFYLAPVTADVEYADVPPAGDYAELSKPPPVHPVVLEDQSESYLLVSEIETPETASGTQRLSNDYATVNKSPAVPSRRISPAESYLLVSEIEDPAPASVAHRPPNDSSPLSKPPLTLSRQVPPADYATVNKSPAVPSRQISPAESYLLVSEIEDPAPASVAYRPSNDSSPMNKPPLTLPRQVTPADSYLLASEIETDEPAPATRRPTADCSPVNKAPLALSHQASPAESYLLASEIETPEPATGTHCPSNGKKSPLPGDCSSENKTPQVLSRQVSPAESYLLVSEIENPEPAAATRRLSACNFSDHNAMMKPPVAPRISPAGSSVPTPEHGYYQWQGLPPVPPVIDERRAPVPPSNMPPVRSLPEERCFEESTGHPLYFNNAPGRIPPRELKPVRPENDDLYINDAVIEQQMQLREQEARGPPPPPLPPRANRPAMGRHQLDKMYINVDEHQSRVATTDIIAETAALRRARQSSSIRAQSVQDSWL